ncbi:sensor histidine kinase [Paenibacillus sp. HB172176]|uniref:cache domain-containing sensor histidine kinase n=1 Tax=Paenibacillus sp. HB172176 TaxID=2493690 RepID=UPI001439EEA5|nr:sensor histidine kinase [Paenibacillus sp. HB172176]
MTWNPGHRSTWMQPLSFRNKLKYAFLAVTIIAVLVTGVLSYYISASTLEEKSLSLTQDTVVKSSQILDEKLNKLMLVMMTFMISEPFKEMLSSVSAGDSTTYYKHLNNLDNVFSQARVAEPLIHSIYVSTPIGDFYPLSINRNHSVTFRDTALYDRMVEANRNIWIEGHEDQLFTGKQRVVSLVLEPISDVNVRLHDVYVVVNIRESGLLRLIGPNSQGGSTQFLVDGESELVTRATSELVQKAVDSGALAELIHGQDAGYTIHNLNNEPYYFNYASLGLNDWKIVAIQSKANVLKDLTYLKWTMVFIAIGCFIAVTLLSTGFIRILLRPMQQLMKVMKRVENNDLTARFEVHNGDELAQIGLRFNRMLEQIVSLIDDVKLAETNKRTTEIKALSAQMDPHFLYNTLNTIYWKMKLNKTEESKHMVVSLSRLFQLGLNKGKDFTTLEKEMQHARQYLELQKYCYEQLFDYSIELKEESLRELEVPRIMLQPLVENCILHGFSGMEAGGSIAVVIEMTDVLEEKEERQFCLIRVEDNGAGVDADTKRELMQHGSSKGYAISNLLQRLQLYYGEEASLSIDSEPGQGMIVLLSIPVKGMIDDEA